MKVCIVHSSKDWHHAQHFKIQLWDMKWGQVGSSGIEEWCTIHKAGTSLEVICFQHSHQKLELVSAELSKCSHQVYFSSFISKLQRDCGACPFYCAWIFAGFHGCSLPLSVNDSPPALQWANQSRLRGLLTLPVIMQFPLYREEGFCEKIWSKHSSECTSFRSSYDKIIVIEQSQIIPEFINHYNILIIYLNFMGH